MPEGAVPTLSISVPRRNPIMSDKKQGHDNTTLQSDLDIEAVLKRVMDAGSYPKESKKGRRPSRSGTSPAVRQPDPSEK